MPSSSAQTRSQLMQLLGMGLAHPVPDFHRHLQEGSYQASLAELMEALFDASVSLSGQRVEFVDLEADYIRLFQVGNRGRPIVSRHAGDYDELLGDRSRPVFMLDYVSWYKHFGIKVRQDEQENELPDHLVCQFEFLAWLAHLEAGAVDRPELKIGYQRAQRDFLQRHLIPMVELMVPALQREAAINGTMAFFGELCSVALDASTQILHELESVLGPAVIAAKPGQERPITPPGDHRS